MDRIEMMALQTATRNRFPVSALAWVVFILMGWTGGGLASPDPVSNARSPESQLRDVEGPSGACRRHADCSDGNVCNGLEICRDGVCISGETLECSPRNACVLSICDPRVGCKERILSSGSCDDGNACTTGDLCKEGRCVGGEALACRDEGPCVFGICDPASGCSTKIARDGSVCDDGRKETKNDSCQSGQCRGEGIDPVILEQLEDDRLFDLQMDADNPSGG